MIDVHDAAIDRRDRIFVIAGLVQGIGVNLDLKIILVRQLHAGLDCRR